MSTTQKATGGTSTRRPLVPAQLVKPPTPVEVEPPSAPLQSAGSLMLTTRVVSKREVANGGAKSNGAGLVRSQFPTAISSLISVCPTAV